MIIAGYIIISIYIIIMIVLLLGYQRVPLFKIIKPEELISQTKFSIIIPFRNEAENLPDLLTSITKLNYPLSLFEIIWVDDDSEDFSVKIIKDFFNTPSNIGVNIQIIANVRASNSPKKDAITSAIKIAQFPWIVTTDADCILPNNWLKIFDKYIQKNEVNMMAGPVSYIKNKSLVNAYQQLDNYSLQTTTIGCFGLQSPLLCNGANLAYRKENFIKMNGFSGNNHLASGDDVFLLEKFVKGNSLKVKFVKSKEAMVVTKAENSWKQIISQRIRWASKTTKQKNSALKGLGITVFITNLMMIILVILGLIDISISLHVAAILLLKIMIDSLVVCNHATNFDFKIKPFSFFISEILYPLITIFVVFGSLKGTYIWKKRTFKK